MIAREMPAPAVDVRDLQMRYGTKDVLIGLVLAPIVLGRMARRKSGSTVAAARERSIAKGY
jgi:hypothetical protein